MQTIYGNKLKCLHLTFVNEFVYKNLNKVILSKCLSALADIIQEYVWVFIWNGSFKHAVYLGLWFKSFFLWYLRLTTEPSIVCLQHIGWKLAFLKNKQTPIVVLKKKVGRHSNLYYSQVWHEKALKYARSWQGWISNRGLQNWS